MFSFLLILDVKINRILRNVVHINLVFIYRLPMSDEIRNKIFQRKSLLVDHNSFGKSNLLQLISQNSSSKNMKQIIMQYILEYARISVGSEPYSCV